jgi:hypothetical protein
MRFDLLTAFGLFAVTAMLLRYALERKGRQYILGFSIACVLGSIYCFFRALGPSDWLRLSARSLRSNVCTATLFIFLGRRRFAT